MSKTRMFSIAILLFFCFAWLAACSKETPQPKTEQAAQTTQPPAQASTPQAQPAQTVSPPASTQPATPIGATQPASTTSGKPAGPLATEKHSLGLTNYGGTAITVSINGQWVGQWDAHASAPLDSVVQGKNEVTVELQGQPNNTVTLEVNTVRSGQTVNLLRLNFQGKPAGTYNYYFVAR